MPNTQQNNEIEHISQEINLLQDLLKKNQKKSESISKWVKANRKNTSKKKYIGKIFFKPKEYKI